MSHILHDMGLDKVSGCLTHITWLDNIDELKLLVRNSDTFILWRAGSPRTPWLAGEDQDHGPIMNVS